MNRLRSLALLLGATALAACEKNAVQDITGPLPAASIKFFNFGVGSPRVHFFANDTKLTATFSSTGTESIFGVAYGQDATGGYYTGIEPGQYTISGRITATTDKDLPISSVPVTIEAGKQYSFYQSGIYDATTKTVDGFIVEDDIPEKIDYTVAYVRFVNAISNANPMILYVKSDSVAETAIGGAVAYKSAGEFVAIPGNVYTLTTRYPGSATNVITRTGVSFERGRVYTVTAGGDITSTAAASRPLLDNTANR